MIVTVIGIGLIGGSMVKDLKREGFASKIIGVDAEPKHAQRALELKIVDEVMELKEGVEAADLVLLSTPVDAIVKLLPKVLDYVSPTTTVTDTGSTKVNVCEAVDNHPNRKNYVPSHPMCGTENSGPDAALEGLFNKKITIICNQERSKPIHVALIEKMYYAIGMSIAYMTSDEHDHTTANVSHLPHIAAFALANAVLMKNERDIIFDLASGGFRSTARLAKSSPAMWGPIFKQNQKYVLESLDVYIEHLKEFRESIIDEDQERMYALMENANRIRPVLEGTHSNMKKHEQQNIKLFK